MALGAGLGTGLGAARSVDPNIFAPTKHQNLPRIRENIAGENPYTD